MSSYITRTLIDGENVVYQGKLSFWGLFGWLTAGSLFLIPAIVHVLVGINDSTFMFLISFLCFTVAFLKYKTTELAFTNKRLISKSGIISRKVTELNISKIESFRVQQGIIARMLNFGTLVIAGGGNPEVKIPNISKPLEFHRAFMKYQDNISAFSK